MGIKDFFTNMTAGRRKLIPNRDTVDYPRLMNLGQLYNNKAQVKPSPPNIRYFSRTPYARAAIRCIRDSIQSLEWEIIPKKGVNINSSLESQIAIATTCFEHPNNDDNWREFIGKCTEDWLCCGAATFEQQLSGDPIRPIWLWPVDAQSIQIYAAWSGNKNEARYVQTIGYTNVGFLEGRKLRNDELVFIRANSSTETPYGFGPLEIAFNSINRQLGVAEYTGNLASNALPKTILYFPNADTDKLNAWRDYWQNEIEGQGKTPMYGGKEAPQAVKMYGDGDNDMYLGFQEFVLKEIATAFGLSPMNLGVERDINRNTAEVSSDRDWDNAVVPPAELIANHITREVLHLKLGFYQLDFKFKGLYREDEESRATIYETYYKNNLLTPNEHRETLGLPLSTSQWADLTFADTQIALAAARGTSQIVDDDIDANSSSESSPKAPQKNNPNVKNPDLDEKKNTDA